MTEAAVAPPKHSFPDSSIDADPQMSLKELTKALEEETENAEYYCQRAYAQILLQNYTDAVLDAKRSLELQPNNASAFLRKGEAEFHLQKYSSAVETFRKGQMIEPSMTTFTMWVKRCEEKLNESDLSTNLQAFSKYRHDWYQTESHIIISVMIKNVQKNDVNIRFLEKELTVEVNFSLEKNYQLSLNLLHSIVPEQSTFKVLSTKIEIKLKKAEGIKWEKLEGQVESHVKQFNPESMHTYPSSSHYTKNWDKLVVEIKEEEKNEKLEGDAALNQLFQQIYSDGSDEVKRAMNKSFMESGGTVLSTNWSDVGKKKVEVNPPEDMEWKKF
ncbi:hypothetical protein GDO86_004186 [Hymenochirus boettgeri]|uniref:Protein SGT1 homolog n=1 Tax=Hymenochirus boettgeri TaxID=247094 RepID=A0A8T2K7V6_9PIPI|nr:hypothetical protein GDO86_004186 [Hymenochirus boettgeri]KAG8452282.1 hypothetical protein GDO86_004186 [Hymenochirus boettgeri]KAG8452283.1 hypothetical protein GDO86_004186 [Hymenochirus boettgeri]